MSKSAFDSIAIRGIACAVPNQVRTSSDWISTFGQEAVDKFVRMTGVSQVHCSHEKQTASDLAYVAADYLLAQKGIDPKSVQALIFVTQSPDYRLPATAFVLQHRLGISQDSICFDVNLGCSGYVNGIALLSSIMAESEISRALLLVGDTSSKVVSPLDRSSAMLFGDGGSATLLEKTNPGQGVIRHATKSDGHRYRSIIRSAGGYRHRNASLERTIQDEDGNLRSHFDLLMDGPAVFAFSVGEVPKLIKEFLREIDTSISDYDCVVFHQANMYILRQIMKRLEIPESKVPLSIDRYGNTSVTSIPLTLCDAYGEKVDGSIEVLLCGFGVGLSWGVLSLRLNKNELFPIQVSGDSFKGGHVSHE